MALWGIPLILTLSYLGGYFFLGLVLLINGMSLWEFYSIFQKQNMKAYRIVGLSLSTVLLLITYWFPVEIIFSTLLIILILIFLIHLRITTPNSSVNTTLTLAGIFYISFFSEHLIAGQNTSEFLDGVEFFSEPGGKILSDHLDQYLDMRYRRLFWRESPGAT